MRAVFDEEGRPVWRCRGCDAVYKRDRPRGASRTRAEGYLEHLSAREKAPP